MMARANGHFRLSDGRIAATDDMKLRSIKNRCKFLAGPTHSAYLWPLRPLAERLRYDANILDAGLAQTVHHRGPASERHRLVAPDVDGLMLEVVRLGHNLLAERVDVDRLVIQIDSLGAVNGNHHANDSELLHRLGFRDIDVDAGLQDRGRDHENNQKDKHDVDERNHIDFGK